MADFHTAHKKTSFFEGGYQCMREDNGNWTGGKVGAGSLIGTKYGIAAPVLKAWLGLEPTMAHMKSLSRETADEIFKKNYWKPIKGDEIKDQETANQLYDMAVNAGVGTAIKLAYRTVGLPESTSMTDTLLKKLNEK